MKHKYQTFVEDLSDKVKTNPKTFWSFFHDKTQSKAIPDTLTDGDQSILNQQPKQIYLTIIFNLFLQFIIYRVALFGSSKNIIRIRC